MTRVGVPRNTTASSSLGLIFRQKPTLKTMFTILEKAVRYHQYYVVSLMLPAVLYSRVGLRSMAGPACKGHEIIQ